jgi:Copper type II ascorbate-dependent monooxygenase, C-terminal domain
VNLLYAKNVMYQAGTMVSFNTSIDVPAATSAGPGTQTVSGTCTAPTGAQFFTMSTHTHKHATAAWVDYIHDGQTTEIVHTGTETTYPADQEPGSGTDWEHPGVGLWTAPNFLTVQAGDSFTYHCAYSNTASTAVTVGETACCNEMCMAIGYYFPAGTASCD